MTGFVVQGHIYWCDIFRGVDLVMLNYNFDLNLYLKKFSVQFVLFIISDYVGINYKHIFSISFHFHFQVSCIYFHVLATKSEQVAPADMHIVFLIGILRIFFLTKVIMQKITTYKIKIILP